MVRPAAARYVFLGGLRGSGRVAPSQVICKLVRRPTILQTHPTRAMTTPVAQSTSATIQRHSWQRRLVWLVAVALVVFFFKECARLAPSDVATLPSGEQIQIIQLGQYRDVQLRVPGGARTLQGLLLDYYPLSAVPESLATEADRVVAFAGPVAERQGDSLIIVRQTVPLITKLLWFDRRYDWYYRRDTVGVWRRFGP